MDFSVLLYGYFNVKYNIVKPQNTKAMKIPISLPTRNDIIVHVFKNCKNTYSATCAEIVNEYGLDELNNWEIFNIADDENMYAPTSMFDVTINNVKVPCFIRATFEDALKDCLEYVYDLYGISVQ